MTAEVAMMLHVAMTNPGSPTNPAAGYRRAAIVLGAVIVAHLLLLFIALNARNRVIERPVETKTLTALLLSPEPPATPAPAAVVPPAPPVVRPAVRPLLRPAVPVKPVPQPHTQAPRTVETPLPTPSPSHESATPAAAPPVAQPAAPQAVPQAALPSSAPAAHAALPASTEPRNVPHVDCSIPKPDFPDISKRRGEHGIAVVRLVVGLNGRIETAQLLTSSGYARLDDAALAAVHAGSCQPYIENGTPVRVAHSVSLEFKLTE
jgi:periplasmic protein TonB